MGERGAFGLPRKGRAGRLLAVLAAAMAVALGTAPSGAQAAADSAISCRDVHVPVSLREGQPRDYDVYGELCTAAGQQPHTVQVLLPGGTYSTVYWDFPYQAERYSYVRHVVPTGYATFAMDRIGHGRSSHPLSALVDTASNAFAAHQIVQALRGDALGVTFDKVMIVGHSYGSTTAMVEAATYQDVDAVIITGMLHKLAPLGVAKIGLYLSQAAPLDSRFGDLDAGYLTTQPGTRSPFFYDTAHADPKVIQLDEETKDTATVAEAATFTTALVDGTTQHIHVPVLVVVGQNDAVFCGLLGSDCSSSSAVQQQEQPYYPKACVQSYVLTRSGHDVNLHRNAADWYAIAHTWTDRHVGAGAGTSTRC